MISATSGTRIGQLFGSSPHDCGTRHPCGLGVRGLDRLISLECAIADEGYPVYFLFSNDLRPHDFLMRFLTCLLATAVLQPVADASPTSLLPGLFSSWSDGLGSLWRKPSSQTSGTAQLDKRQTDDAFDHNPDGSQFLWVLQDTYQGKSFFECVAARPANRINSLTLATVDGPFSQEQIQRSKSHTEFDGGHVR